jgi:hypothetical protein
MPSSLPCKCFTFHCQQSTPRRRYINEIAFLNKVRNNVIQRSRESVVSIATDCVLDDQEVGVRVLVGLRIFTSSYSPDRLWGPLNLLSNGYRGVKRQSRESEHSTPTSAEVKKMCIYTSTPLGLYGVVLS